MPLANIFDDALVARRYRYRAPYPAETFAVLRRLLVAPRTVLDAGAGTGALARHLVMAADRIDAIDPSAAMIAEGKRLPGGSDRRLCWIQARAEDAPLEPPYGLIVAGTSMHWMDARIVMPRFARALAPGAWFAIVESENSETSWRTDVVSILDRYSGPEHHAELPDTLASLEANGLFAREGQARTGPETVIRSVDEYLEALHSTSEFAHSRLGERTASFDSESREVLARRGLDTVRYEVTGTVVWGRPLAGA